MSKLLGGRMKRKLLATLLSVAMATTLLAGCGSGSTEAPAAADSSSETTDTTSTEAVKELGKYALTSKDELLAEAMADYVNSKEPLPFSKEVVRLMQEKLKE